jgi:hypothetical protein
VTPTPPTRLPLNAQVLAPVCLSKTVVNLALAACAAAGMIHQPGLQVLSLTPDQLPDVSRLHRFSSTEGGSVFGARDLSEVLGAAAGQQDG